MDIKLKRMQIRNFKSIESLEINFDGKDTVISGRNRIGKSSVADAFFWCLFGKNKENSTDSGTSGFSVRRIDENGMPVTDNVSVQVTLDVDGNVKDFIRENTATFDGDKIIGSETLFFIKGCIVKKKEYEAAIDAIINGELFRIMSDPFFFPQLKWERQRELLTSIAPESEVPEKYAEITAKVDEIGADSIKKSLNATIRDNETRISQLQGQIEGIRMTMPSKQEWENVNEKEASCNDLLNALVAQLDDIKDDNRERICILEQELNEMLMKEKNRIQNENAITESQRNDLNAKIAETKKMLEKSEYLKLMSEQEKESINSKVESILNEKKKLYDEWYAIKDSIQDEEIVCPIAGIICKTESVLSEYRKNFKQNTEKRLSEITREGNDINKKVEILRNRIEIIDENIKESKSDVDMYKENVTAYTTALNNLPQQVAMVDTDAIAGYAEKEKELNGLREKSANTDNGNDERRRNLKSQIESVNAELATIKALREDIRKRAEAEQKIADIGTKIDTCKDTISEAQKALDELKEYQSAVSAAVEQSVNTLFGHVKVRMFETQLNGAIADTCRLIDENGVKWSDWSTSEKTLNGLDIINAFAKHYNVSMPVFIDNAEGISTKFLCDQQTILFVVTEEEQLTITNL